MNLDDGVFCSAVMGLTIGKRSVVAVVMTLGAPADRVQQAGDSDVWVAFGTGGDHGQQNKPCLGLTLVP